MARDFSLSCSAWLAKEDCDRKWNGKEKKIGGKNESINNGTLKEILAGKKKKKEVNEMKYSTKWLTKGRIELLMEEEESLLRRAIAAIAISLSWSGLWERVFGILWNAFLFGEGSGCGWVGGWGWFVKHNIIYVIGKRACLLCLSLSLVRCHWQLCDVTPAILNNPPNTVSFCPLSLGYTCVWASQKCGAKRE